MEGCHAAGIEGAWAAFSKPGAKAKKAIRVNLDQAEKESRSAAIRAGTGIEFQRHVTAELKRRGRTLQIRRAKSWRRN